MAPHSTLTRYEFEWFNLTFCLFDSAGRFLPFHLYLERKRVTAGVCAHQAWPRPVDPILIPKQARPVKVWTPLDRFCGICQRILEVLTLLLHAGATAPYRENEFVSEDKCRLFFTSLNPLPGLVTFITHQMRLRFATRFHPNQSVSVHRLQVQRSKPSAEACNTSAFARRQRTN